MGTAGSNRALMRPIAMQQIGNSYLLAAKIVKVDMSISSSGTSFQTTNHFTSGLKDLGEGGQIYQDTYYTVVY